jgi:Ca2+-binding EF-hand superfamily protein
LELNLTENPCVFQSYDFDGDGLISKDELESKIGVKKGAKELFALVFSKDGELKLSNIIVFIWNIFHEF